MVSLRSGSLLSLVEIIYIDMSKSCIFWWHLWFQTLDVLILFLFSLMLSINSSITTSLHSRCIWEEVCGIMINVLVSRVWSVPYILYIALWVKLNTYSSVSFLLLLVTEAITLPPWNAPSSPLEVDVLYRKAKKERESYSVCHSSSSETLSQSHQFPFYPWYPQTVRHPDHTRSKQQGISSRTTLTR